MLSNDYFSLCYIAKFVIKYNLLNIYTIFPIHIILQKFQCRLLSSPNALCIPDALGATAMTKKGWQTFWYPEVPTCINWDQKFGDELSFLWEEDQMEDKKE